MTLFVNFIVPPAPEKKEEPKRPPPPKPKPEPVIQAPPMPLPPGPVALSSELSVACPERSAPAYPAQSRRLGETPLCQTSCRLKKFGFFNLRIETAHQYGDGVALDYSKAMQWYRVAADQCDKISQFQIGLMYQTGQGVAANEEEAHRWFTAHRKHHMHHLRTPQMVAWREQARALIDARYRREQLAASRKNSDQVLAELKQRAGMGTEKPTATVNGLPFPCKFGVNKKSGAIFA